MKQLMYLLMILTVLSLAGVALADGSPKTITLVEKVWVDSGVTYVQTAAGLFELTSEVSAKEDAQATKYLSSVAGTEEAVSFSWGEGKRAGNTVQVISADSVSEFAAKRIYVGNLPFSNQAPAPKE